MTTNEIELIKRAIEILKVLTILELVISLLLILDLLLAAWIHRQQDKPITTPQPQWHPPMPEPKLPHVDWAMEMIDRPRTAEEQFHHEARIYPYKSVAFMKPAGRLPFPEARAKAAKMTEEATWKPIKDCKIPLNIKVDIRTGDGKELKMVEMIKRNPMKFIPEFVKYKNIIAWRYHQKNA